MKRLVSFMMVIVMSISLLMVSGTETYAYTKTGPATNDYTTWKQTSSTWGDVRPWPNASIPKFGDAGCWITSVAMLLRHYNVVTDSNVNSFNPITCNSRLMQYGIINSAGDYQNLSKMNSAYPGFSYVGEKGYSFSNVKSLYDSGYAIIVHETRGHYVAVRSVSGNSITVMDPGYNTTSLTNSDKIQYFKPTAQNTNTYATISGANVPGTLNAGSTFSIYGTISSASNIKHVSVGVYNASGNCKTGTTVYPNTRSYNIHNVDNKIWFDALGAGVYRYVVSAGNSKGTATLVNKVFVVLGNQRTINDGNYSFLSGVNRNFSISIADNKNNDNANVHVWQYYNTVNYMKWNFQYQGNGYYKIQNLGSGKYLDVLNNIGQSGNNVQQYQKHDSTAQLWQVLPDSTGKYYLIPKAGTFCCLDLSTGYAENGKNIQIYNANMTASQRWELVKTEKYNPAPIKINVSKISLSGISKNIAAGKKIKLTASVYPENASNKALTWKSSNTRYATVSSNGTVTLKKGFGGKTVTITAIAKDGSGTSATYKIHIMKGEVSNITISGAKSVKVGKTISLKAKVNATNGANTKLKWVSSNKKYATVTANGQVKGLAAGKNKSVKITAKATDGSGKTATVTVKIN